MPTADYISHLNAGNRAFSQGEWELAADCFGKALGHQETTEALEAIAAATYFLNDATATIAARERAYALHHEANNHQGMARVAGLVANDYGEFRGDFAIAIGWLSRGLRAIEKCGPCREAGFLTMLQAHVALLIQKDPTEAILYADSALRYGRTFDAPDIEMLALALRGLALVSQGEPAEGMRLLDEATAAAIAGETDDINAIGSTCCYLIAACERIRDYDRAAQWCIRISKFSSRWRMASVFGSCRTQYASILMTQGRWEEAEQELMNAATMLRECRPGQVAACTVRIGELRRRQGRFAEAEALFAETSSHPLSMMGRAAIQLHNSNPIGAIGLIERYLRRVPLTDRIERVSGLELLLRAQLAAGNGQEAKHTLAELREIASRFNTLPLHAAIHAADGAVAGATGNLREALLHLEDAIDLYDRTPMPFEGGCARIELAHLLYQLGDHTRAGEEARAAEQSLQRLGALRDAERATALISTSHGHTTAPYSSASDDFTRRETEVLMLVAAGKSNEEIATELFLSIRTVERHVSNIYLKLGATGRTARAVATAWVWKQKK
ncbi:MAG: tetratricopeptide repeat protein [Armatimonadetes bacterium]|nr:tetratricopeptide repeat protein [Armatimonadota bacterium]